MITYTHRHIHLAIRDGRCMYVQFTSRSWPIFLANIPKLRHATWTMRLMNRFYELQYTFDFDPAAVCEFSAGGHTKRTTRISLSVRVIRWRTTRMSQGVRVLRHHIRGSRSGELEVRGTRSGELEAENSIFTHLLDLHYPQRSHNFLL